MSKKIEKFIEENRTLLDTEEVPAGVWEKIKLPEAPKIPAKKTMVAPLYKWSLAAAVAGFVMVSSVLLIKKYKEHTPAGFIAVNAGNNTPPPVNDIEAIAPQYAPQAEAIYKSIANKKDDLKIIASTDPELYRQFASDLATLDSSYRVLKMQAATSPNHDVIIKAMIQNLQLQAELLSRQLIIINQFKNQKKESHETNNTLQRT